MKNCFVILAVESDEDPDSMPQLYAVTDSEEVAEKIAERDESDGQIHSGWTVSKMKLNSLEDV